MGYEHIKVPDFGEKIVVNDDHSLSVPDHPIIPYIEGDGIGVDISPVMINVVNAAVEKAYGVRRKISWMEIFTGEKAAELYVTGIYGNTMTTNPRALETAVAVLESITPELRQNIRQRGKELKNKLEKLMSEFPESIISVQGTGLLVCAELHPEKLPVIGFGCVEEWCRLNGLGVIHGGENALRFTPRFGITTSEIDIIIDVVRKALIHFK